MGAVPVVSADGVGEQIWFGGGLITFKVTSAQTNGAFAIIEDVAPKGKTTPLHVHDTFDETFYVIDGELLVHIDGTEYAAGPGAVAAIPRGLPHAFLVVSESAHFLGFATPGDVFERFLREGGEKPTGSDEAPPLDIERVRAAGEKTGGMRVLGPPPFAKVNA